VCFIQVDAKERTSEGQSNPNTYHRLSCNCVANVADEPTESALSTETMDGSENDGDDVLVSACAMIDEAPTDARGAATEAAVVVAAVAVEEVDGTVANVSAVLTSDDVVAADDLKTSVGMRDATSASSAADTRTDDSDADEPEAADEVWQWSERRSKVTPSWTMMKTTKMMMMNWKSERTPD
jgi:hypothetical protein